MLRFLILITAVLSVWSGVASAEPPALAANIVGLQRHTAGTFYISGALEGYGDIEFLMDTGSSFLVINETILQQLKISGSAQPGRELGGVMADGTRQIIPTYRLSALRLGEYCWIRDVEAAVFPGNARPIVGMNILAHLAPFTFSTEPPQLGLNVDRCHATAGAELPVASANGAEVLAP